ncbi:MAG: hypothetical protein HUU41_19995 [Bryobacteraceae bacterium]|nr:hypothetical protein [Bryobacterales bacterium]MEB2362990.1 hypothetical protein [Bryobacterales bacterium]NUN03395.1 hypothetical protein [Bryobacteraceae bacterium]
MALLMVDSKGLDISTNCAGVAVGIAMATFDRKKARGVPEQINHFLAVITQKNLLLPQHL